MRNLPTLETRIAMWLVLAAAGALLCKSNRVAAAEQWVPIAVDSANVAFAVDVASITREGDRVTFRERVIYAVPDQPDAVSGKLIKEKQVLRVMHCNEKTQGLKSGSVFDEHRRVIESVNLEDQAIRWSAIPQGTVAERELALVCDVKTPIKPGALRP